MKKYSIFFLLLITLGAVAQMPVLVSTNTAPQPGDVFTSLRCDTTGIQSATPGPDQIWDYSTLETDSSKFMVNWIDPSGTPYFANFPLATVCNSQGDQSYSYAKVTDGEWSIIGTSNSLITYTYTDPEKIFGFPFTYGNEFTDTVSASGTAGGVDHYRNGYRTVTGEGWGKLILPSGEYPNLLLVKVVQHYLDSSSALKILIHNVVQIWMDGTQKNPLLEIYKSSNRVNDTALYNGKIVLLSLAAASVEEKFTGNSLLITPNPARDKLTIQLPAELARQAKLFVMTDNKGKSVMTIPVTGETTSVRLDGLAEGIYIIRTTVNGRSLTAKFLRL